MYCAIRRFAHRHGELPNLLIYFAPHAQKRVVPVFHYALNPGAFLTLGPAETIGAFSELFSLLDDSRSKIYVRKAVPGRRHLELPERHVVRHADTPVAAKERCCRTGATARS